MAINSEAFNGPIPGQSLTTTPGNYPWEQPPQTENPDEALLYHISRMADEDFVDGATTLMELDVPIEALTNTILTSAVGDGIHTIDVGIIIAPSVHKELVSLAKMTGIEYKEFFSDEAEKEALEKKKLKALVLHKMKKNMPKEKPAIISETTQALGSAEVESFENRREQQQDDMSMSDTPKTAPMSEDLIPEDVPQEQDEEMMAQEELPPAADQGMGLMSRGA